MAPRKRSVDSSQDGPRKSTRLSGPPQRLGFEERSPTPQLREPLPLQPKLEFGTVSLLPLNDRIAEYNRLLAFVHPGTTRCFQRQNSAVRHSIKMMDSIMDEALERVNEHCSVISSHLDGLEQLVMQNPHWYTEGDLLALSSYEMESMLEDSVVLYADHFDDFVRPAVITAWEKQLKEQSWFSSELLRKICQLLQKLIKIPDDRFRNLGKNTGPCRAFHTAVYLKSRLLESRSFFGDNDDRSKDFDDIIHQCLKLAGIGTLKPEDTIITRFYDCAAARRDLWSQMSGVDCSGEASRSEPKCVHSINNDLLETLQKHAQEEIHHNVMLATGRHLPVELAELVYEATLEAEEIPLDWIIRGPPVKSRRDAPKHLWQLLPSYSCPVLAKKAESGNPFEKLLPVGSYDEWRRLVPERFYE